MCPNARRTTAARDRRPLVAIAAIATLIAGVLGAPGIQNALAQTPQLTVTKDQPSGSRTLGSTLAYTIDVTNSGDVSIDSITIDDPLTSDEACPQTTLAPSAIMQCGASYVITQSDIDAGSLTNTVTIAGVLPDTTTISQSAQVTTTLVSPNSLDIAVTGTAVDANTDGMVAPGETIDFTYVVTNNGPTVIADIALDDPLAANESCPQTTLAAGAAMTCTGTHVLTQSDIDGGTVVNTTTATGTDTDGSVSTGTGTVTTTIAANSDVQMTKVGTPNDANADGSIGVGETIDYVITVTNVGNTTVSSLAVSDPTAGNPTCDVTELGATAVATCTVSYALTQADIDASSVDNTAIVTGSDPAGATVTDAATATTRINVNPSLRVTKTTASTGKAIGDVVDYTITVENDGNLALANITLNDPMTANETCPATQLAVGESMTCTAAVTISQADIDAGAIENTATATGSESGGTEVQASGSNSYPLTSVPSITAQKSGQIVDDDSDGVIKPGETINYTILVTNDGDLTVNNLAVADPIAGPPYCDKRTLAPGETATCTVTDHVRSGDPDAGFAYNAITATADASNGTTVSATAEVSLPIESVPSLLVVKTNDMDTLVEGEVVHYNIVVNNTGNTTISNITIQDDLTADETCPQTSLSAGNNMLCTASYTITADDMAAGQVENLVIVRGQDVAATLVEQSATTVSPYTPDPQYVIVTRGYARDLDADGMLEPGDTVFYTVWLSNVGNTLFDPAWVTDAKTGDPTCDKTAVAPGQTTGCTIEYVLTQADVDAGSVQNQAVGHMTLSDGTVLTGTASDTTTLTPVPRLDVAITAPLTQPGVGDTTQYSISLTNSGNVTIDGVAVTDSLTTAVQCPNTTLVSGETMICTATYTVTQGDVDAGSFSTTVTATGADPNTTSVTKTQSQTFTVSQTPKLAVLKKGMAQDANGDGVFVAGDQIDYTITVTNSGDVTLGQLAVADAKTGPPTCDVTTLAPGAVTTCRASYIVTQSEVDAGSVINTATASAKTQSGQTVSAQDTEATSLRANPSLAVTKTAADGPLAVGEAIGYSIEVTNTGNVRLSALTLTDPMTTDETCSSAVIDVGQSVACTATHVVTQGDVDAGSVDNTVQAETLTPLGTAVQASASHAYPLPQQSGISVGLQATIVDADLDGIVDAGETIDYVATVTNTGTVTLSTITVTDASSGSMTCDAATLAPGADAACTSRYTLTQSDIDATQVETTATASALTPGGDSVSDAASVTTPLPSVSLLEVTKSAPVGDLAVGQTIDYVIDVRNTGNRDVIELAINDPLTANESCPQTVLAPGASMVCGASYQITQADVDAGAVENTVTASGVDPGDAVVTGQGSHAYPFAQTSGLSAQRSGTVVELTGDAMIGAGDAIDVIIEVLNAGTVTLSSLSVVDDTAPAPVCDQQTLAPGQTAICTSRYLLTQDDLDAGQVVGSATASALDPGDVSVVEVAASTEYLVGVGAMTVDKSAPGAQIAAGDTITYSIVITNTGTLTLSSVAIADVLTADEACPENTIAPGEALTCSATYVATQQDVDAGMVQNTVDVSATDSSGATVSASDSHSYPFAQSSVLEVVQSGSAIDADVDGQVEAAETVQYTVTVTNGGTVTLSGVAIQDAGYTSSSCPTTTLAPAETMSCAVVVALSQDVVDAGELRATVIVEATSPDASAVTGSDPGAAPVAIAPNPRLAVTKSSALGQLMVGDTIDYSVSVTNTGNVTISDLAIDDPLTTDEVCPQAVLAPGEAMQCSASYQITQGDVDAGSVDNTATMSAVDPGGLVVTEQGSHSYPFTVTAALLVERSSVVVDVDADGLVAAGDAIDVVVLIRNEGTVTVSSLSVVDDVASALMCDREALAPGESATCSARSVLSQADVDAGEVIGTASASALDPSGGDVIGSGQSAVSIEAQPAIAATKSAPGELLAVGETIGYVISVTNTGNVTMSAIGIDDALTPDEICPEPVLAPGASMACSASYRITQGDVDAGSVENTVTVVASPPVGAVISTSDSHAYPFAQTASLAVAQTGSVNDDDGDGQVEAGESVTYSLTVTNVGNVTVGTLGLVDDGLGSWSCGDTALAPGVSTSCQATYVLTQVDIDAGQVARVIEVTALDSTNDLVAATDSSVTALPIAGNPSISITKSAQPGPLAVGDTISYAINVTNTGNVGVAELLIEDQLTDDESCPRLGLSVGETMTCTATYTISPADVEAGAIDNTAQLSGTASNGADVTGTASNSFPVPQHPALDADMAATVQDGDGDGVVEAGEMVGFDFVVTNPGDVAMSGLTGLLVPDTSGGLGTVGPTNPDAIALTCVADTLAPLATTTCAAVVVLNQAEVDAANLTGVFEISATHDQEVFSVTSEVHVPLEPAPELMMTKSQAQGTVRPDSAVTFDVIVTNGGNVTLAEIVVADPIAERVECTAVQLAPGESLSCTAFYTVTSGDRDAGTILNTATVTGRSPTGETATTEATSSTPVPDDRHVTSVVAPTGSPATVDVVNDNPAGLVAETIKLIDPATFEPSMEVVIPGEGTWSVTSGTLVFTPEASSVGQSRVAYLAADATGAAVEGVASVTFDASVTPTATPAPTATPEPTAPPEPTATQTPVTATPALTATPVPTATGVPVPTATAAPATPVPTATATPVPTATSEPTATATPAPTVTPVPTATSAPTPTGVAVPTASPVPTPTSVPTATGVPVPTTTSTPAPTMTPTPTQLPTQTASPVPTATATSPVGPEPTATEDVVVQPTETVPGGAGGTATPTATVAPNLTATPTPVPTGTVGPTPSGTVGPKPTGTVGPTPTGTVGPKPTGTVGPTPTGTVGPTPTGTVGPTPTGTVGPTPTGTVGPKPTGTVGPTPSGTVGPTPTGTVGPAEPPLAFTGRGVGFAGLAGLGLILGGFTLVVMSNRSRRI